jgi:hypothetical protein
MARYVEHRLDVGHGLLLRHRYDAALEPTIDADGSFIAKPSVHKTQTPSVVLSGALTQLHHCRCLPHRSHPRA